MLIRSEKTAAAMDLPHNVKPGSVFAFKSGRYTNAGLDMGQYEETRTLSVAITYEDGNVYGWYDLRRMGEQNREEAKGKGFGPLESVSEGMISTWVSGLFHGARIDEPNGWAGPSMGHGSYRLGQLLDMQKRGKIEELRSEAGNLTWAEKVVLSSFGYKSSYAGIRDYRKHEAMNQTSITDKEYEAARDSLKRRGFIRPNNALSPMGKEAREGLNVHIWQLKNRTAGAGDLCFYVSGERDVYIVDSRGCISTEKTDWKSSGQWIFKGVSFNNLRSGIDVSFDPRTDPKDYVGGYVWDYDHGSTRRWGRKITQAWRDTASDASRREWNSQFR
jgi:hypothetical protein